MTGLGVVLFIVFALLSVGLHEFGHFSTAKLFGIKVERFFIGFGPRLWSVRKGETEYGIAALPLGGYVRIAGMNPFEPVAPEERARTFRAKPAWQRAIVLAAGSTTHFILAIAIVAGILATAGQEGPPTRVVETVTSGAGGAPSPAAAAGIRPGDEIVAVDGVPVARWEQTVDLVHARPGRSVTIDLVRGGQALRVTATLAPQNPEGKKVGFLGVSPRMSKIHRSVIPAFGEAARLIGFGIRDSLVALRHVFSPDTIGRLLKVAIGRQERRADDPATIIGVGKGAGDLARHGDFAGLFYLIAGFNVFIGVVNLVPLPPLDGGHLAVVAYESIRRREVDMRRLLPVTAVVITILGSLFLLLLYLDIVRPIPSLPG